MSSSIRTEVTPTSVKFDYPFVHLGIKGHVEFVGQFTPIEIQQLRQMIIDCNTAEYKVFVKNSPIKCPRFVVQRWQKRDRDGDFATVINVGIQRRHEIGSDIDTTEPVKEGNAGETPVRNFGSLEPIRRVRGVASSYEETVRFTKSDDLEGQQIVFSNYRSNDAVTYHSLKCLMEVIDDATWNVFVKYSPIKYPKLQTVRSWQDAATRPDFHLFLQGIFALPSFYKGALAKVEENKQKESQSGLSELPRCDQLPLHDSLSTFVDAEEQKEPLVDAESVLPSVLMEETLIESPTMNSIPVSDVTGGDTELAHETKPEETPGEPEKPLHPIVQLLHIDDVVYHSEIRGSAGGSRSHVLPKAELYGYPKLLEKTITEGSRLYIDKDIDHFVNDYIQQGTLKELAFNAAERVGLLLGSGLLSLVSFNNETAALNSKLRDYRKCVFEAASGKSKGSYLPEKDMKLFTFDIERFSEGELKMPEPMPSSIIVQTPEEVNEKIVKLARTQRLPMLRTLADSDVPIKDLTMLLAYAGDFRMKTTLFRELERHTFARPILEKCTNVISKSMLNAAVPREFYDVKYLLPDNIAYAFCDEWMFSGEQINNVFAHTDKTGSVDKMMYVLRKFVGPAFDHLDYSNTSITGSAISAAVMLSNCESVSRMDELLAIQYPINEYVISAEDKYTFDNRVTQASQKWGPSKCEFKFEIVDKEDEDGHKCYISIRRDGEEYDVLPATRKSATDIDMVYHGPEDLFEETAKEHFETFQRCNPFTQLSFNTEVINEEKGYKRYSITAPDDPSFRTVEIYAAKLMQVFTHHVGIVRGYYGFLPEGRRCEDTLKARVNATIHLSATCLKTMIDGYTPNYYYFASKKKAPLEIVNRYITRGIRPHHEMMREIPYQFIKVNSMGLSVAYLNFLNSGRQDCEIVGCNPIRRVKPLPVPSFVPQMPAPIAVKSTCMELPCVNGTRCTCTNPCCECVSGVETVGCRCNCHMY